MEVMEDIDFVVGLSRRSVGDQSEMASNSGLKQWSTSDRIWHNSQLKAIKQFIAQLSSN